MTRDGRFAIADDSFAHRRAPTVGADQRHGIDARSTFKLDDHAVRFDVESGNPAVGTQLDPLGTRPATVE